MIIHGLKRYRKQSVLKTAILIMIMKRNFIWGQAQGPLKGDKRKMSDLAAANLSLYVSKTNFQVIGQRLKEALKELLGRRFRKVEEFPDLLLIDGGKGQLSAALEVKQKLNIPSDIAAIAKEEERLFMEDGNSLIFPEDAPERFLPQNIRDEVHRRAITHHRKRRQKL